MPTGMNAAVFVAPRIMTGLRPGGRKRTRRPMQTITGGRLDTGPLVTHRFSPDTIAEACGLFANPRGGVPRVAITA